MINKGQIERNKKDKIISTIQGGGKVLSEDPFLCIKLVIRGRRTDMFKAFYCSGCNYKCEKNARSRM